MLRGGSAPQFRRVQYARVLLIPALLGVTATTIRSGFAATSQQPVVTKVYPLFKGRQVQSIIAGAKGKRYWLEVYGVGFSSASTVVVNGQTLPTQLTDTNELTARLSHIDLTPGALSIQVVNPDGQASNFQTLDVVTDPAVVAVRSISKTNGPVGTQVNLTGIGFAPAGNQVTFVRVGAPTEGGIAAEADSPDGTNLTFSIPPTLCRCVPPCVEPCVATAPAQYRVLVTNPNGTSSSVGFLVSSASGPIGVWGADRDSSGFLGLKLTVTDTEIAVEGGCFGGIATATLTTDEAGNFSLPGFLATEAGPVGPVANLRLVQLSGSIKGSTMVLTITGSDSTMAPIGPFTLSFGLSAQISHPCV